MKIVNVLNISRPQRSLTFFFRQVKEEQMQPNALLMGLMIVSGSYSANAVSEFEKAVQQQVKKTEKQKEKITGIVEEQRAVEDKVIKGLNFLAQLAHFVLSQIPQLTNSETGLELDKKE